MDESKDIQEVAIKGAEKFLGNLVKHPVEELSALLGSNVAYWRFKNTVTLAQKAETFLEKKGVKPEQLSVEMRDMVPLLEYSSYEDDPTLQDMWASLLASYATASMFGRFNQFEPKYAELLRQLAPVEAKLLLELYKHHQTRVNEDAVLPIDERLTVSNLEERLNGPYSNYSPFLANFERLDLVEGVDGPENRYSARLTITTKSSTTGRDYETRTSINMLGAWALTSTGYRLIEHCTEFTSDI